MSNCWFYLWWPWKPDMQKPGLLEQCSCEPSGFFMHWFSLSCWESITASQCSDVVTDVLRLVKLIFLCFLSLGQVPHGQRSGSLRQMSSASHHHYYHFRNHHQQDVVSAPARISTAFPLTYTQLFCEVGTIIIQQFAVKETEAQSEYRRRRNTGWYKKW